MRKTWGLAVVAVLLMVAGTAAAEPVGMSFDQWFDGIVEFWSSIVASLSGSESETVAQASNSCEGEGCEILGSIAPDG